MQGNLENTWLSLIGDSPTLDRRASRSELRMDTSDPEFAYIAISIVSKNAETPKLQCLEAEPYEGSIDDATRGA